MSEWNLHDLMKLNVGQPGRLLKLELPIGRLLDKGHAEMVQKLLTDSASDGAWEMLPAKSHSASSVPRSPGVYMFVWCPPLTLECSRTFYLDNLTFRQVLYIGKAGGLVSRGTLQERFKTYIKHFGNDPRLLWSNESLRNRSSKLNCFLSLEPLEYWFLVCKDESDVVEIEKNLIRLLNPPINKKEKTFLKQGKPQAAFK